MATTSIDEEVSARNDDFADRLRKSGPNPSAAQVNDFIKQQELENLKQQQRKKNLDRVQKLARAGQLAAALSGHEELYDLLGEGAGAAKRNSEGEGEPGALRNAGSNLGGRVAGKLAGDGIKVPFRDKKLAEGAGLGRGQAAAIGGAVAGALEGEGVGGIAKSAISWWVLDIIFGSLFTLVFFVPALIYLDFHYVMNKMGSKLFGSMNLWQKTLLVVANMIAVLIPIVFMVVIYTATCGNVIVSTASTIANKVSFGYLQDICSPFQGGQSGGAGATGTFTTTNDDAINRRYLSDHGITVNNPFPTTSLAGMRQDTLSELVIFKQNCDLWAGSRGPCTVVVTGGTEDVHAEGTCSHANGYKADIRANTLVDQFVTTQFASTGVRSDGARLYTRSGGGLYARESDHWDMVVDCT